MHIIFNRIRFKNFLSTGNNWTEIEFGTQSTTLFMGVNGSGKSTLLDALCYVLFNKPFRNINKPQLKNSINQKNMMVEISFCAGKDQFIVKRGMTPNIFEIYKNGEIIDQNAASRDYQEILEKYYLRMNYKTFKQVDILGSASFTPFMQLTPAHRREVIEDLLDIQIFSTMNVLLKEKTSINSRELIEVDYKLELINEKIKLHESHIKTITEDINERKKELSEKIRRLETDRSIEETLIEEDKVKIRELQTQTVTFSAISKKHSKILLLENQLREKSVKIEKDKNFFINHDNCPTCNQIIDTEFKNSTIQKKESLLNEISEAVRKIALERQNVDELLKQMEDINIKISEVNMDIGIRNNKIKNYTDNINDTQKQIDDLKKKFNTSLSGDNTTKKLEIDRDNISLEKKRLMELKEIYRASALILKDTGIKSRIIKQYVPIINKLINKYLSSMDFFVQFELDENFSETIKSRFRDIYSYASFSEGEKSKIDLALLFTWRTISKMRNSASTNILILDEVFSSALDVNSSEELLKILKELSKDSNIIIISHRTDQLIDKMDKVMKFEKVKNFSSMKEISNEVRN